MSLEQRQRQFRQRTRGQGESGAETDTSLVKELEDKVNLEQKLTPVSSKN